MRATPFKTSVDKFKRALITEALYSTKGNRAAAAKRLGTTRSNFYKYLVNLNIDPSLGVGSAYASESPTLRELQDEIERLTQKLVNA